MKYAILLAFLGIAQVLLAIFNPLPVGILWLLVWSGLSWILVGIAYSANLELIFGKRSDGTMSAFRVSLFLPFLLVTWVTWYVQRALTKESVYNKVAPGVYLGRRCSAAELPPDVRTIIDLTAEFAESQGVRHGRTYICVPMLDASIPAPASFRSLLESVSRFPDPIYIHCAQGHGRSAMAAAAALVVKGLTPTLEEAIQTVKRARPAIKISAIQHRLLEEWVSDHRLPVADPRV